MAMHIQGINLYNISLSIFDKMFLEDEHNYRRMLCTESLLYRVRLAWHTIDWSTPHPTHTNTHVHAQKKNEKNDTPRKVYSCLSNSFTTEYNILWIRDLIK